MTLPSLAVSAKPETYFIACPHCNISLACIKQSKFEYLFDGHFIDDGDWVFGVDGQKPNNCELNVGKCRKCRRHYYIVECAMLDSLSKDEFETGDICRRNRPVIDTKYMVMEGEKGFIETSRSRLGLLVVFNFGPFYIDADEQDRVIGPFGVMSCRTSNGPWETARALLLKRWDEMRRILDDLSASSPDKDADEIDYKQWESETLRWRLRNARIDQLRQTIAFEVQYCFETVDKYPSLRWAATAHADLNNRSPEQCVIDGDIEAVALAIEAKLAEWAARIEKAHEKRQRKSLAAATI